MLGASAGALLGVLTGSLLQSVWLAVGLALIAAVFSAWLIRKRTGFGLLLLLFAALCLRTGLTPRDAVTPGRYVVIGTVAEEPNPDPKRMTLTLRNVTLDGQKLSARLSLSASGGDFRYGDTIRVTASVSPANRPTQTAYRGVWTTASASERPALLGKSSDLYGGLLKVRGLFSDTVERLYGDQAAIAKGLLLGDRSEIDDETEARYADSGILHLFAVSGLHVTILVTLLGGLVNTGNRVRDLILIALAVAFYAALTAFTPSILRAGFYLLAIRLPLLRDRQSDPPSAFCFSLVMTLLVNPYSMYSLSFLLSFAAMAGILLLSRPLANLVRLPYNAFSRTLVGSCAALLGTFPIQCACFQSFAWMSLPMSLLLVPVLPVLMPLAFLSMLLGPVMPHLAKALAIVPYGALVYIDRLTVRLHASRLMLPAPNLAAILCWYAGLVFLSQMFLPNRKRPAYVGFALIAASIALWMLIP